VKLWDNESGQLIRTFEGHDSYVTFASFNPNGTRIVSSSWDGTVRIWDTDTGQLINILTRHSGSVMSAIFSPSGKQILSASEAEVIIWDADTGLPIQTMEGVYWAAFSANEKQIVSFGTKEPNESLNRDIIIYDFPPLQELIDQTRERFKDRPLTAEERRMYYLE